MFSFVDSVDNTHFMLMYLKVLFCTLHEQSKLLNVNKEKFKKYYRNFRENSIIIILKFLPNTILAEMTYTFIT